MFSFYVFFVQILIAEKFVALKKNRVLTDPNLPVGRGNIIVANESPKSNIYFILTYSVQLQKICLAIRLIQRVKAGK